MSKTFDSLVQTSADVASTTRRKQKIERLASFLEGLSGDDLDIAVAFLVGELRQGRIGLGPAVIGNAAGAAVADCSTLTLVEVDAFFERIAGIKGKGSANARLEIVKKLFGLSTAAELRFLVRLIVGELRQGALEAILAEAVAVASKIPAAKIRRAMMLSGDARVVAKAALEEGAAAVENFGLQIFRPLQPMLALPSEGLREAFERHQKAALEFKMDGARIQIHKAGNDVRIFTRKLNDVTASLPEIVEEVLRIPARQLVLDGEVLALRPDGSPHAFQTTMRRFGRKLDVEVLRSKLPLSAFFFDCLHIDGDDLIDLPTAERFRAMAESMAPGLLIPRIVTENLQEAEDFLAKARDGGHEGLMVKSLTAVYGAGKRGHHWLKIKPAQTLDLVVLAAEWGGGRRRGWLSNLHLGARDPESGGFVMLGKTFKGLTDHMLAWQTEKFLEIELSRDAYTVYVKPQIVVEIAFNEVQASPNYPGGMALRFARVKRYRPDKQPKQADTIDTVRDVFLSQGGGSGQ